MFRKSLLITLATLCMLLAGCTAANVEEAKDITLATTTSTEDSGLLDYLLPEFKKDTGISVMVVAKGTGEAMELAKRGDADCILVHAKDKEIDFVKEGYGVERFDVMYNDFIIVGSKEDAAKIKERAYNDPELALKLISEAKSNFVSRGDESGTHTKEKGLWKSLKVEPSGEWYISAGKGMGAVLQMAYEKDAYTLTDRATYLSMKDKLPLEILCEKSDKLYNQYGVIKVNPEKHQINDKEAQKFVDWIISDKAQKLIEDFGKEKFGQSLFIPNAK